MSGFGEWRAYAERGQAFQGPGVHLHIRREIAPNRVEVVHGDLIVSQQDVPENAMVTGSDYPVVLDEEMAKAVYQALHRLYGHENPDGRISALQESLNVERSRVNAVLQGILSPPSALRHQRPNHEVN